MNKRRKDGYIKTSFTYEGKRYYVYGKTKQELVEKEAEKRKEVQLEIQKKQNPILEKYFERWFAFNTVGIAQNTIRTLIIRKETLCNLYIKNDNKKLGEYKIKDINIDVLIETQQQMAINRNPNTVNAYMYTLKNVLHTAMKEGIIESDPFILLKSLKPTEEKARDTYHRALTLEEQHTFFNAECVKNSLFYNVYRFAIVTGMRIGEIGGLKYKDIKKDHFTVERTLTRIHGDVWGLGEDAKTKSSRRKIPITDEIKKILNAQIEKDYSNKENINPEDLVFKSQTGRIIRHTRVNEELKNLCKKTGIAHFTMHSFRDTFATRAIESGMNPKTLQEILGHKDYAITMNLYAHAMDETKEREMKNLHIDI